MVKRIISFIVAIVMICSVLCVFSSCGNKNYWVGEYTFTKVHIFSESGDKCIEIKSWKEADVGVEVKLAHDMGSLWLSEGTYMLVEKYCPICGE